MDKWSIKDADKWSDELKAMVEIITGGHMPGKPIREDDKHAK